MHGSTLVYTKKAYGVSGAFVSAATRAQPGDAARAAQDDLRRAKSAQEPHLGQLGANLGQLGPNLGQLGANLGQLGANLGPPEP